MESFLPQVDSGQLKAQLNQIMAEVNAATNDTSITVKGIEEAGQCIIEFANFFVACAEQHGSTPHAVLGQHVVTNVFIFVLERIVKPNLTSYCRVAEKHASNAMEGLANSNGGARRDALDARRRRLRGDIIRPFIQLFQSLHTSLSEEGEPLTSQQPHLNSSSNFGDGGGGGVGGGEARAWWERNLDTGVAGNSRSSTSALPFLDRGSAVVAAGGLRSFDDASDAAAGDFAHSLSQAPLLWKNASPLNILCNHALEVLESQWLAAVVGADYAALLLEVLRWHGYARLVTPIYLVRLSSCLVGLLERVSLNEEAAAAAAAVNPNDGSSTYQNSTGVVVMAMPNLVFHEVADGGVWVAMPSADDACVYAQVLSRLYGLAQVTSAFPPSVAAAAERRGGGEAAHASVYNTRINSSSSSGGDSEAMALVRRLVELVKVRHRNPTPDLRLEAYCIAALRQLCARFQYDHPSVVARAPVELVKLLCNFFFLPHHTPRHDVWRLEVMQFVAVVLSYALADVVGDELWRDLRAITPLEKRTSDDALREKNEIWQSRGRDAAAGFATGAPASQRELMLLLHQIVYPTMRRIFTQHRHEYSFISRRELFSFPCKPLQEVFDFGAVVLYLCSATHDAYVDTVSRGERATSATSAVGGGAGGVRGETHAAEADTADEEQQLHGLAAESEALHADARLPRRKRHRMRDLDEAAEKASGVTGNIDNPQKVPRSATSHDHPHPVHLLCDALRNEFFQSTSSATSPPLPSTRTTVSAACTTRRRSGAAPLVLKIRTAGIRTNSAAVQDVVSDQSLFLLHLFAQPCSTLSCPSSVTDALVEDVLLPLSAAFGLRMGPLLLATIAAVVPHCSADTQAFAFSLLAQRSLPVHRGVSGLARGEGGGGIVAVTAASSVREDLLVPSESTYRVLVTLLESRLCQYQACKSSFPSSSGDSNAMRAAVDAAPALGDVHVVWDTHLQATVQRVQSQLHTFEQAVSRLREATVAAAEETNMLGHVSSEVSAYAAVFHETNDWGSGGRDGAASVSGSAAPVAFSPVTAAAAALAPLLTHTPALTATLAAQLMRVATLTRCVRLWRLTHPRKPAECVADVTDDAERGSGLAFVLHIAAHGVFFYERVPLLSRAEAAACQVTSSSNNHNSGVEDGNPRGADAFASDKQHQRTTHSVNNAALSFTAVSASSSGVSGTAFLTRFSAADFLAWLDTVETYGCTFLWSCRAHEQLVRRSQLQSYQQTAQYDRGAFQAMSVTQGDETGAIAPALTGAVYRGVERYLEAVCADISRATAADALAAVPAVLHDATEVRWMLRVQSQSRSPDLMGHESPSTGESEPARHHGSAAGADDVAALAELGDGAPPALPRSFQVVMANAVQDAVKWLMRRAQLLERVRQDTAPEAETAAGVSVTRPSSKDLGTGGVFSGLNAMCAAGQRSASLVLEVQCVQMLHVLLRWRRAGLWYPPAEPTVAARSSTIVRGANDPQTADKAGNAAVPKGAQQRRGVGEEGGEDGEENDAAAQQPLQLNPAATDSSAEAAARADVHIFTSSPGLFDSPAATLERFSIRGGGRLYYTVLWLCHFVAEQLQLHTPHQNSCEQDSVLARLPLWVALRVLYRDVGAVLLEPAMSCKVDPRQTLLRFTAVVSHTCLHGSIAPLSRWQPTNLHARELRRIVTTALNLSLDITRLVTRAVRRTGVSAYAVVPLVNGAALRTLLLRLLEQQTLAELGTASARSAETAQDLADALLPSQHPLVAQKYPFLPTVLPVLPGVFRLLLLLSTARHNDVTISSAANASGGWQTNEEDTPSGLADCRTVVRLLQILFARYRYQVGPALCSALLGGPLAEMEQLLHSCHSFHGGGGDRSSAAVPAASVGLVQMRNAADTADAAAALLYTQSGRLLELWTAQMTNASRVDMPVCTPQWQCALLQAAFAVLVRCEPVVAEVLGRFSFEFLSESTPYVVRRHAALHVGVLFRTFSARRAQVLHTLLMKAREGMLSPTPMLCLTSLLALSEAVRAAPELGVDVVYTLLECWATRGFTHRRLIVECMTRLSRWVREGATRAAAGMGAPTPCRREVLQVYSYSPLLDELPYTALSRLHVRPLLFLWLCEYQHPLVALPVSCFGYATLAEFVVDQLPVLLPLALLLLTESNDAEATVMGEMRPRCCDHDFATPGTTLREDSRSRSRNDLDHDHGSSGPAAAAGAHRSLFHQLLQIYTDNVLLSTPEAAAGLDREESRGHRSAKSKEKTHSNAASDKGCTADSGDTDDADPRSHELRQLAPLCLVLQFFSPVVVQLLVVAANAPVPFFGDDAAADLDVDATATPANAGRPWQQQLDLADVRDTTRAGRSGNTAATTDARWCEAAQKCLYWIEVLLNTCEAATLVQAGAYVWLGRFLAPNERVLKDVTAAAGAAVLSPATATSATEVLVFYLQRHAAWPTVRPAFDVVLAAQMDTVAAELVRLHRTPTEPAQVVYGTPEQLRRALAWVAGKVVGVPLIRDVWVSAHVGVGNATATAAVTASSTREGELVAEDATQTLGGSDTSKDDLHVWQARCLRLLVPPLLLEKSPDGQTGSHDRDHDRHDLAETLFSQDALSCLFLLGNGTFLRSLLHTVYHSCLAPTSLEGVLRAPRQLTLLTAVTTRWCSSRVLAHAPALRVVLLYLLHLLHQDASADLCSAVCTALLHVWPVAVSGRSSSSSNNSVRGAPTKAAANANEEENADAAGQGDTAGRQHEQSCGGDSLGSCAVLLSRVLEPLAAVSPVVASTWAALCRSDSRLRKCEWHRRAEAYAQQAFNVDREASSMSDSTGSEEFSRTLKVVVDVDDSVDDDDEAEQQQQQQRSRRTKNTGNVGAAAAVPTQKETATALSPRLHMWSWSTYSLYRSAFLAPLQRKPAQRSVLTLLALLHHICGRDDCGNSDVSSMRQFSSSAVVDSSERKKGHVSGDLSVMCAADAASPPSSSFLCHVAAGVDRTRELVVRCLEVAAVWSRENTQANTSAELHSTDALADDHSPADAVGAAADKATATGAGLILYSERIAVAVQHAVLGSIAQLYRWCVASSTREGSPWSMDFNRCMTASSMSAAATAAGDVEGDERVALACFDLLRSLSLCVLHAGAAELLTNTIDAACHSSLNSCSNVSSDSIRTVSCLDGDVMGSRGSSANASAEQLVAVCLGRVYVQQLEVLERLTTSADPRLSGVATHTLRTWTLCLEMSAHTDTSDALSSFDAAVIEVTCGVYGALRGATNRQATTADVNACLSYAPHLLHRLLWAARSRSSSCSSSNDGSLFDLTPPASFAAVHITQSSVWRPLHASPPDEREFLPRFVVALAHTYGILKKSALWTSLLPLLYAEASPHSSSSSSSSNGCGGGRKDCAPSTGPSVSPVDSLPFFPAAVGFTSGGCSTSVSASLLTPLLLHLLCLRETDGQRALRKEWSTLLDRHVIQQAGRCPHIAQLFVRVLYTCHVVLVRMTRQRGLKGSSAGNRAGNKAASTGLHNVCVDTVSVSWPAAFGAVPILQDMQECYWLSDIPARHLAEAAVVVQEPYLALVFAQLSGESLFGPRTGSAALCGAMETTRSAVLLREGIVGAAAASAVSSGPYSVLFPCARCEDYQTSSTAAGTSAAVRSGGRARQRQDSVRQQTQRFTQQVFRLYAAVQQQVDVDDVSGVSVVTQQADEGTTAAVEGEVGGEHDGGAPFPIRMYTSPVSRDTISGSVVRHHASLQVGKVEGEAENVNDAWVNALRDLEEEEQFSYVSTKNRRGRRGDAAGVHISESRSERDAGASTGVVSARSGDPWHGALSRAVRLLERDLPSTAMDVLLSLNPHRAKTVPAAVAVRAPAPTSKSSLDTDAEAPVAAAAAAADADAAPWTAAHEACLRSLLSEAAWRCAQWSRATSVLAVSPHSRCGAGDSQTDVQAGEVVSRRALTSGAVSRAALERLAQQPHNTATSPAPQFASTSDAVSGGVYEHLLRAFLALASGEARLCLPHLRNAEVSLRLQLSPISAVSTVVAAEALSEVRQCACALLQAQDRKSGSGVTLPSIAPPGSPTLPGWLAPADADFGSRRSSSYKSGFLDRTADFPSQIGKASWQLWDSVRHALCQICGSSEGTYRFLMESTERALAFHSPELAHRWLVDWERSFDKENESTSQVASSLFSEQRSVDVALRKAQVAYALGRWQEALALLQSSPASSFPSITASAAAVAGRTLSFSMPQEPRVVQQLMLWHAELQLVPPSQLVRDPFLSRAAASDSTGACSFALARLCHTLANEIAARLTSHEHAQLEESVGESKRQRRELEAQLHSATTRPGEAEPASSSFSKVARRADPVMAAAAVVLTDEQLRLIRRRIRELAGDIKRLEDEWEGEKLNYGLYRRSALNAYSRFLQFHQLSSSPSSAGAAAAASCHPQQQTAQSKGDRGNSGGSRTALQPPTVTCIPVDSAENTLHAVFGFVELWLNAQDVEQSGGEVLGKVLDKAVERIPTAVFLPLASQLTAQLGSPQDADRLSFLVNRIAQDYPLQVVWPLLALRHGRTFASSREVNTLHAVDEAKIQAAQDLLAELATSSQKAAGGGSGSRAGRGVNVSGGSASAAVFFPEEKASTAKLVQHAQLLSSAYLELAFDKSANAAHADKRYTIKSDFLLLEAAHHLVIPPPTSFAPSSDTAAADDLLLQPCVLRYRPYFTTPGGVNVPKVLLCELSDGQVVRQLLKAGDDLRQDALIEQVFTTANQLFLRRESTRPLRIRTFTIVPLAPTAGILQWVEHTLPLGEYLTGRYNGKEEQPGAHERYFPGEPTTRECRLQLQNVPPRGRAEALLKLYDVFTPALHYFFFEQFTSAQAFVLRQQTFTRSVAAASMVGYVVGLGDRHINNILLHQHTAEVVHIDLGIAFDQNRLLPVPELVPFRMTRNIIDGLGVRGTEGSLRPCAEAALGLMRAKRELLRTLLNSIMHDPLARWAVGGMQQNADAAALMAGGLVAGEDDSGNEKNESLRKQQQQQLLLQASTRQVAPMRARASRADAARTLARIDAKLRGYDSGDVLSVATHVRKLMEEAQRVENLAVMFPGWSQWV